MYFRSITASTLAALLPCLVLGRPTSSALELAASGPSETNIVGGIAGLGYLVETQVPTDRIQEALNTQLDALVISPNSSGQVVGAAYLTLPTDQDLAGAMLNTQVSQMNGISEKASGTNTYSTASLTLFQPSISQLQRILNDGLELMVSYIDVPVYEKSPFNSTGTSLCNNYISEECANAVLSSAQNQASQSMMNNDSSITLTDQLSTLSMCGSFFQNQSSISTTFKRESFRISGELLGSNLEGVKAPLYGRLNNDIQEVTISSSQSTDDSLGYRSTVGFYKYDKVPKDKSDLSVYNLLSTQVRVVLVAEVASQANGTSTVQSNGDLPVSLSCHAANRASDASMMPQAPGTSDSAAPVSHKAPRIATGLMLVLSAMMLL